MDDKAQSRHDPAAAILRVYLLGPPRVEWAGRPLPVVRRQARALLYRLAIRPEPVPREHLCFLLWPDASESTARRSLSHLLTHLTRALPDADLVQAYEDGVRLHPQRVWSDTAAFESLCTALARTSARSPISEGEARRGLQEAVDLYAGPFLAGFSLPGCPEFEAWAAQEQRALEHLYFQALIVLLEESSARGEYEAAIAYAQRYLDADALAEDVHRRLIQLYAAAGNRSAALQQFERCVAALENDLGVSPLPETRAVYQAVLEGRPLARPAPKPAWVTLPGLDAPLVGRDDALRTLDQAHARARSGQGGVILIAGESGIGKSRLMQDFATRLQGRALVLVGAGLPGGQTLPYQPIVEALRGALQIAGETLRVQPMWLAEASRLLPDLRDLYPDLPPPMPAEPEEARARLFEALCRLVLRVTAGPRPVLLCLDDLHWADGTTLDWLAYLARYVSASRLLVIGAYRSEEVEAVAELRHSLARLGLLCELRLAGLDTGAIAQLLRHLARSPWRPSAALPLPWGAEGEARPPEGEMALAERLQRATGGNPFFLLETLRALMETGQMLADWRSLEDFPLPDTIREAVEARLGHLSMVARQVLEAGAVLGLSFDFNLVRMTAGRRELETMDSLDELVARQLLVETAGGRETYPYRFQHELTRRVVEAGLGPVRRQLLHRRAGRALERLAPDAIAAMAHHFDAGGEDEKALRYHGLVAQRAEAVFAWREAEEHQSRMLGLLDRLDPDCSRPGCLAQRAQVLTQRARLRYLQGRLAERDADLAALAAVAESTGDEGMRLQASLQRARYLNLDGWYGEAIRAAEEGLRLADGLADATMRSHLLVEIGFAHYLLGQPREGLAALESALEMAGEQAVPAIRGPITHNLGYLHAHRGEYARALAYQEEAYACHEKAGDYNGMAWAALDIGFLLLKLGRYEEAWRRLTESVSIAQRIGARPAEAYAVTYCGYWELYRGDYAAAANRFRDTLLSHQMMHQEHGAVAAEVGLGLALCNLGDHGEARRRFREAVERARSVAHRRRLAEALIGLGLAELADGDLPTADGCLAEAVELARVSECRENLAAGLIVLARAARQEGDPSDALAHAREAVRIAVENALTTCEMWGEVEIGLALLAQGEAVAALEHTGRAVDLVSQAHEGWGGTEGAHRAHARVLQALGRAEDAEDHIRRAEALIAAKADRIPDSELRRRYLQSAQRER
ncbi:MAG: AAA family ATPase [Anaerolineae bacterium]|nr:AAA family ATPase [Anaerolineae bacterium]